ncbi:hypothetical protein VQ042_16360 [Aurantimonas sp. A2-1-M11]|uniref:hypothetical protein n=1 Tax=Aurantimonas sp. A2-1-M11 TaxID=3113712 RepID=UPI002F943E89
MRNIYLDEDRIADIPATGTGLFRATLAFGALALVLSLLVPPIAERGVRYVAGVDGPQLDMMATGSIARPSEYTLRRSVLQPANAAPCVIYADGRRHGGC